MIQIKLAGANEFLETSPDTTISMKLENPIFGSSEKLSPGSFSLPFNLPGGNVSERNSRLLKNPDVIENMDSFKLSKATIFFNNTPFKSGNLKVSNVDGQQKLSSYFTFGLNTISTDLKSMKLRALLDEIITIPMNVTKKIFVTRDGDGNADWSLTINGTEYQGEDLGIVVGKVNTAAQKGVDTGNYFPYIEVLATNSCVIYPAKFTSGTDIFGAPTILSTPSTTPHEHEVTVQLPSAGGYGAGNYTMTGSMTGYYEAFNSFLSGYPTSKICFPVLFNANPYGSTESIKATELVNGVDANGIIKNDFAWGTNNGQPGAVKNYNSLQPFLFLKWVLDRIATRFNFTYEGDFYDSPDLATRLIDNTFLLDVVQPWLGNNKFVFWNNSFNVAELVPDISVIDLFKALQSRYNIAVYQNEQTGRVRLQFREPIARSNSYEEITPLSTPKQGISNDKISGWKITIAKEDTDALSTASSALIGTTAEEDQPMTCASIQVFHSYVFNDILYQGVRVSRKQESSFKLRIFHHAGAIVSGAVTYQGSKITGVDTNETIADLVEKYWNYWMRFEKDRVTIKISIEYPFRTIREFEWELKRRYDRSNYLIKSMDIKLTNDKIKVNAELYTMRTSQTSLFE